MKYKVIFHRSAYKDLRAIPEQFQCDIRDTIQRLCDNPLPIGSIKLQDTKDFCRIRVVDYRIIYRLNKQIITITIIRIRHRKDTYKNLH